MSNPTLPVQAFVPANTVFGSKALVSFTPTGGSAINIVGKLLNFEGKLQTVDRKVPDANGILRTDRSAPKEADETFSMADIDEIDTVVTAMGSLTARKVGSAAIFIFDPDQASGTVREYCAPFPCTAVVKSGTTKFGGGGYAMATIDFISNNGAAGPILFVPNQAVS